MRTSTALLTLFAILFLAATAPADEPTTKPAGDKGTRHKLLHGIVKKIDGKNITLSIGKGDAAKEVTVETDDNTQFTVDHQAAKLDDIKEGEVVAVVPAEGVAQHVDVNTTHRGHHKGAATKEGGAGEKAPQ